MQERFYPLRPSGQVSSLPSIDSLQSTAVQLSVVLLVLRKKKQEQNKKMKTKKPKTKSPSFIYPWYGYYTGIVRYMRAQVYEYKQYRYEHEP